MVAIVDQIFYQAFEETNKKYSKEDFKSYYVLFELRFILDDHLEDFRKFYTE